MKASIEELQREARRRKQAASNAALSLIPFAQAFNVMRDINASFIAALFSLAAAKSSRRRGRRHVPGLLAWRNRTKVKNIKGVIISRPRHASSDPNFTGAPFAFPAGSLVYAGMDLAAGADTHIVVHYHFNSVEKKP